MSTNPDWSSYINGAPAPYMVSTKIGLRGDTADEDEFNLRNVATNPSQAALQDHARLTLNQFSVPHIHNDATRSNFLSPITKAIVRSAKSLRLTLNLDTTTKRLKESSKKPKLDGKPSVFFQSSVSPSSAEESTPSQSDIVWPSASLALTPDTILGQHTERLIKYADVCSAMAPEQDTTATWGVLDQRTTASPFITPSDPISPVYTFEQRQKASHASPDTLVVPTVVPAHATHLSHRSLEHRWFLYEVTEGCVSECRSRVPSACDVCALCLYPSLSFTHKGTTYRRYVRPRSCGALWTSIIPCFRHPDTAAMKMNSCIWKERRFYAETCANAVVHSPAFLEWNQQQVTLFIINSSIDVDEFVLFQALIRWCLYQIQRRAGRSSSIQSILRLHKEATGNDSAPAWLVRQYMNPFLSFLRLGCLKKQELAYICRAPSVLSPFEQHLLWAAHHYRPSNMAHTKQYDSIDYVIGSSALLALQAHAGPEGRYDAHHEDPMLFADGTTDGLYHVFAGERAMRSDGNVTNFNEMAMKVQDSLPSKNVLMLHAMKTSNNIISQTWNVMNNNDYTDINGVLGGNGNNLSRKNTLISGKTMNNIPEYEERPDQVTDTDSSLSTLPSIPMVDLAQTNTQTGTGTGRSRSAGTSTDLSPGVSQHSPRSLPSIDTIGDREEPLSQDREKASSLTDTFPSSLIPMQSTLNTSLVVTAASTATSNSMEVEDKHAGTGVDQNSDNPRFPGRSSFPPIPIPVFRAGSSGSVLPSYADIPISETAYTKGAEANSNADDAAFMHSLMGISTSDNTYYNNYAAPQPYRQDSFAPSQNENSLLPNKHTYRSASISLPSHPHAYTQAHYHPSPSPALSPAQKDYQTMFSTQIEEAYSLKATPNPYAYSNWFSPRIAATAQAYVKEYDGCNWIDWISWCNFNICARLAWWCLVIFFIILTIYEHKGWSYSDGAATPLLIFGIYMILSPQFFIISKWCRYTDFNPRERRYNGQFPTDELEPLESFYEYIICEDETECCSPCGWFMPVLIGIECILAFVHMSELAQVHLLAFFLPMYIVWFFQSFFSCCTNNDNFDCEFCSVYWGFNVQLLISIILLHLKLTVRDYDMLIVFSPFFLSLVFAIIGAIYLCCDDEECCGACLMLLCTVPPCLFLIFLGLYIEEIEHPGFLAWAPSFAVTMIPFWLMFVAFYIGILCMGTESRHVPTLRANSHPFMIQHGQSYSLTAVQSTRA